MQSATSHKSYKYLTVLASEMKYPEPPAFLDNEEAELFNLFITARAPNDWRSAAELRLLAMMCQLMMESQFYTMQVSNNGATGLSSTGNEIVTADYRVRNQTNNQIMQIMRMLSLTWSTSMGRKADAKTKNNDHQDKVMRERETLSSEYASLLAIPEVPKGDEEEDE